MDVLNFQTLTHPENGWWSFAFHHLSNAADPEDYHSIAEGLVPKFLAGDQA